MGVHHLHNDRRHRLTGESSPGEKLAIDVFPLHERREKQPFTGRTKKTHLDFFLSIIVFPFHDEKEEQPFKGRMGKNHQEEDIFTTGDLRCHGERNSLSQVVKPTRRNPV